MFLKKASFFIEYIDEQDELIKKKKEELDKFDEEGNQMLLNTSEDTNYSTKEI